MFPDPCEKAPSLVLAEERYWNMSLQAAENIQRMLAKPPSVNPAAKKAAKDLATHVRIRS